jgi:hypothetical protein
MHWNPRLRNQFQKPKGPAPKNVEFGVHNVRSQNVVGRSPSHWEKLCVAAGVPWRKDDSVNQIWFRNEQMTHDLQAWCVIRESKRYSYDRGTYNEVAEHQKYWNSYGNMLMVRSKNCALLDSGSVGRIQHTWRKRAQPPQCLLSTPREMRASLPGRLSHGITVMASQSNKKGEPTPCNTKYLPNDISAARVR